MVLVLVILGAPFASSFATAVVLFEYLLFLVPSEQTEGHKQTATRFHGHLRQRQRSPSEHHDLRPVSHMTCIECNGTNLDGRVGALSG